MNAILRRIRFDAAILGPHLYVPIIAIIMLDMFLFAVPQMATAVAAEFLLPILATWWCIFILQPSLDSDAQEVLFTYRTRLISHGLCSVARMYAYTAVLFALQCALLRSVFGLVGPALWAQLMIQSSFFVGIAFLTMSLTHSEIAALVVCFLYELASWTLHDIFPYWLNIYVLLDAPLQGSELWALAQRVMPMSIVLWVVAQSCFTDFYIFRIRGKA